MNMYYIPHNITVFGNEVKNFPAGIQEAFDALIHQLPENDERPYYGISWCINNKVIYITAAEQIKEGEAAAYDCETYIIAKGDYLSIPVYDWRNKVASIKDVFTEILKDPRADNTKPAIEIYKNDREMLCMVAIKTSIEDLADFQVTTNEMNDIAASFTEEEINKPPFQDSWSAAQVIRHVTKSNKSIASAMKLQGKQINRDADSRAAELRNTFLDYTVKFKSPEFIIPEDEYYDKENLLSDFNTSITQLKEASAAANLSEAISHPAFGEITKLELLHFVLFHMQRHIKQLNNIFNVLTMNNYYSNN